MKIINFDENTILVETNLGLISIKDILKRKNKEKAVVIVIQKIFDNAKVSVIDKKLTLIKKEEK